VENDGKGNTTGMSKVLRGNKDDVIENNGCDAAQTWLIAFGKKEAGKCLDCDKIHVHVRL
jgi:hypothetical protein